MKIIKTKGGYGVINNNVMIVSDETMGVCDSIMFAHRYEAVSFEDMTEGREIAEGI